MSVAILDFAAALEVVAAHAAGLRPHASEIIPLPGSGAFPEGSSGRILAEDVAADRDQPPFDRATRDGFAVRAGEWSAERQLTVIGELRAGQPWRENALASGEAVEIMTGAALPPGADAVAMVEHAERTGDQVRAAAGRTLRTGENIVLRGSEARQGQAVLRTGMVLTAAEIAAAASCGRAELRVFIRPNVAIAATGDELVELEETPKPWQIRNSNGYALAALVAAAGGRPSRLSIARDTADDLRESIARGRSSDLLILSGGVSAGKYDLVEQVLAEFGAEFLFTGVKMQPGRPVVFGRISKSASQQVSVATEAGDGWTYFFGLPGNPVSTEVTFHCFVAPLLRALAGAGWSGPKFAQATLAEDVRAREGLTRLLPARCESIIGRTGSVRTEVRLISWQSSGDLAANARANCYAMLPDGRDLHSGDGISILLR